MRQVIYVVSNGNRWAVRCEHCNAHTTDTQAEAIKIAKQHVSSLPKGTLSQIMVQGDDGRFRTEWTYGSDPFPPAG